MNHIELSRDANALKITLNRPDVLNALSLELLGELRDVLRETADDKSVRPAVLLTGAGRGFCAGADLGSTSLGSNTKDIIETYYNPVARALATMPQTCYRRGERVAAGGGDESGARLETCACSRANASFAVGFTRIGLVMDASASYFLPASGGAGQGLRTRLQRAQGGRGGGISARAGGDAG